ncbi:RimJ/RimL family protein N-acetyltransferase [Krasilnikovia cinnamomea]|uniref:RimJ/RimL family protein N-acetyltransferase n=1 Tax=Krasilnikovia cinnamomea TaxID=349313 RepID=A0A4Q7ZIL4_9ACTN|nr:GNAT family protein [Krasilnikovia cinnamomea]RZU50687.1 RimJ/RimL family protein N-acetyltransferase [Krasilnikovia cinnamomea]
MYPVTLTGRAVTLREFRSDDTAASLAIVGDDQVTQWLSFDSRDLAAAQAMIDGAVERARHNPRTEYYLAVTADDDELVGFVRLALAGVKAAKLGYAIRADRWGKGYATDAARLMITFGFKQLGLHRISAAIGPDNAASIAVAERLGMQYEGRIRDHVFTNGAWRDSLLYAVLSRD